MSDPTRPRRVRRRLWPIVTAGVLTVGLLGTVTVIATSPSARDDIAAALSPEAQAAQTATARADDLKAQLVAAQTQLGDVQSALGRASAAAGDSTQQARADDLKGQVEKLTAKIAALSAAAADAEAARGAQLARADDLAAQLAAANGRAGKAEGDLKTAQAAAADLRAQVAALSAKAAAPRPTPTVTVTAPETTPGTPGRPAPTEPTTPTQPPKTYPVLTKQQIIASRDLFGLYTDESPFWNAEYDALETAVDRDANVSGYFQSWATPFRPDAVQATWKRGEIPMLTWESQEQVGETTAEQPKYSNARILAGDFDDYIRQYARDIAANGQPLIIRFNHEMNGTPAWYPWGEGMKWNPATGKRDIPINGNQPGSYAAMWKHVHGIFEEEGANSQVVWMWAPSRIDTFQSSGRTQAFMDSLYPGDEYVDMVGMSGYNRGTYKAGNDFADIYAATLAQVRKAAPGKPVVLAEVGAADATGDKVEFLTKFFDGLAADKGIAGFVYFSQQTPANNWKIDSTPAATEAFRAGVTDSRFGRTR